MKFVSSGRRSKARLKLSVVKAEAHWKRNVKVKTINAWFSAYIHSYKAEICPNTFYGSP